MNSSPSTTVSPPSASAPRLASLDALRGFDMFWILGADALVVGLGSLSQSAPVRFFSRQLEHTDWHGFTFYDLIFPLFVFIVGVSLVFSLTTLVAREGRATAVRRILRRALLLFLLGLFYNGGLTEPWPEVRVAGVLQRIALAYAATGLLFVYLKPRALAGVAAALLAGYWALMTFAPIRDLPLDGPALVARLPQAATDDHGRPYADTVRPLFEATTTRTRGHFEPGYNVADHFDFVHLPGRLHDRYYDPEGILSTFPAIATCLLGVFAGLWLRREDLGPAGKLRLLVGAGAAALVAGWLWNAPFPVNKKLWTSSFVLVAGGWSFLLLAGFYYVVDVRRWQRWCQPFVWIGMNPITLYLATSVLSFHAIATRLVGGSVSAWFDAFLGKGAGGIVVMLVALALVFGLARFLFTRKIFLRV